ncbi:MAG: hypothetical protein ACRDHW_16820, partial [Ktedonobacteraceae bacterium]
MAPDELALCATHVQTCQPCQAALADLQLTSDLLNGLPQVEVPRSFALPTNLVVLPTTPRSTTQHTRRSSRSIARSALHTLSTIAAVIGLIFLLAGTFALVPHSNTTARPVTSVPHTATQAGSATAHQQLPPAATPETRTGPDGNGNTPTLTSTHIASRNPSQTPVTGPAPRTAQEQLPAVLNHGQADGRLSIGSALLLLGLLG